jgi:hypothetical protein
MTESCKVLRHNDLGKKKNIFGFGTVDALYRDIRKRERK